jgi:hypothetical protein
MTPRTALTLALLAAATAACSRRPKDDVGPSRTPSGAVADVATAYTCAADAAQSLGYAVPEGVAERARSGTNVGGGSYVAERRTPRGDLREWVDELRVSVRASGKGGESGPVSGRLQVAAARFEELSTSATSVPTTPATAPRIRPTLGLGGATRSPRRAGRQRIPQQTPDAVVEHAVAVVSRCAG